MTAFLNWEDIDIPQECIKVDLMFTLTGAPGGPEFPATLRPIENKPLTEAQKEHMERMAAMFKPILK